MTVIWLVRSLLMVVCRLVYWVHPGNKLMSVIWHFWVVCKYFFYQSLLYRILYVFICSVLTFIINFLSIKKLLFTYSFFYFYFIRWIKKFPWRIAKKKSPMFFVLGYSSHFEVSSQLIDFFWRFFTFWWFFLSVHLFLLIS